MPIQQSETPKVVLQNDFANVVVSPTGVEVEVSMDSDGKLRFYSTEGGGSVSGPITSTALTMATGKILLRWSSGAGAIQEGTIGSGLTLSASGVLNTAGITTTPGTKGDVEVVDDSNYAIVAGAVGADELADAGISTAKIQDAAVTGAKIAAGTVSQGNMATDSVTQTEIKDGAVETAKIADGNVTPAKLSAAVQADIDSKQPLDADLTAIAALRTNTVGRSLLEASTPAHIRSIAGSQQDSAELTAIAALSSTSFGRSLLELASAEALRETVGDTPERGRHFTHFVGNDARTCGFYFSNGGSGSAVTQGWEYVTTTTKWLGAFKIETGTTSTGRACLHVGSNALVLGQAHAHALETLISVEALSTASQEFTLWYGVMDQLEGSTVPSRGVFFRYDRLATGDDNWRAVTRSGGVETVTDTGVAVTAGFTQTGVKLKIVIDLDGGEARFYIAETLVATHTANINTSGRQGYGMRIIKSAGTTEVGAGFDWHEYRWSGADDLD